MAAELNKLGHTVTVYERDEAPGGLLRFGVPDAKLEKWIIDRRVKLLEDEGDRVRAATSTWARDVEADELRARPRRAWWWRSARACTATSRCPAASWRGVHFAMDYLYQRNRAVAALGGTARPPDAARASVISAEGKRVVVVGGGDTGMDCISNALREGAEDVLLLDVYPPLPASGRPPGTPWPLPPKRTHHHLRARRGRRAPLRHRR